MKVYINPNQKKCPFCNGDIHINEVTLLIYCEVCTADFTDPKWADGPDENHEVTFDGFEDEDIAALAMSRMAKALREIGIDP